MDAAERPGPSPLNRLHPALEEGMTDTSRRAKDGAAGSACRSAPRQSQAAQSAAEGMAEPGHRADGGCRCGRSIPAGSGSRRRRKRAGALLMDRIRIAGGRRLAGTIPISGAKNATLPLMIASLLTDRRLTLENVPDLADVALLKRILANHGVDYMVSGKRATDVRQCRRDADALRRDHRRHHRALRSRLAHAGELLGDRAAAGAHARGARLAARRLRHRHAAGRFLPHRASRRSAPKSRHRRAAMSSPRRRAGCAAGASASRMPRSAPPTRS